MDLKKKKNLNLYIFLILKKKLLNFKIHFNNNINWKKINIYVNIFK